LSPRDYPAKHRRSERERRQGGPAEGVRGEGEGARGDAAERPLRLFVALDLPDEALTALNGWQELVFGDLPELRINRALHLTLCFLGGRPASAVPALQEALAGVPFASFLMSFGEPIFLPKGGRKNVVALPLIDAPSAPGGLRAVQALQAAVSSALAATGHYEPERRPYLPHVTVARFRRPGHPFPLHIVTLPELCPSPLVLYTSDLDRAGAVHTPLARFSPQ
jgi:RNA 2',3'-cyclic 3'-phosphodiesterase